MHLHVPEELPAQIPAHGAKGKKGEGTKVYRRTQQEMCEICGLYKSSVRCKVCKRSICAPAAINPAKDVCVRDCWARHTIYGFPPKFASKKDWRGPWWQGYEEHQDSKKRRSERGAKGAKKSRKSTGSSLPRNNGL
jgi:hypothetical protein